MNVSVRRGEGNNFGYQLYLIDQYKKPVSCYEQAIGLYGFLYQLV
jgi:hypothetical protein